MSLRNRDYELTEAITIRGMYATGEKMLGKAKVLADKLSTSPKAMAQLKEMLGKHVANISRLADSLKVQKPKGLSRFMPGSFRG